MADRLLAGLRLDRDRVRPARRLRARALASAPALEEESAAAHSAAVPGGGRAGKRRRAGLRRVGLRLAGLRLDRDLATAGEAPSRAGARVRAGTERGKRGRSLAGGPWPVAHLCTAGSRALSAPRRP